MHEEGQKDAGELVAEQQQLRQRRMLWGFASQIPAFVIVPTLYFINLLPLLPVLPGVWRLRQRPLVVAGFILMFHFCLGVMEAWTSPAARLPALVQVALVTIYFIALPTVRRRRASGD